MRSCRALADPDTGHRPCGPLLHQPRGLEGQLAGRQPRQPGHPAIPERPDQGEGHLYLEAAGATPASPGHDRDDLVTYRNQFLDLIGQVIPCLMQLAEETPRAVVPVTEWLPDE